MRNRIITPDNVAELCAEVIQRIPAYPRRFSGRGIVICGGGKRYFPGAWVCIKMLRRHGCTLPIELWYRGSEEYDVRMRLGLRGAGVTFIDASRKRGGRQIPSGWELKPFAIIHSRFEEVIYIDADNVPLADPAYLFESAEYQKCGAIFWPDFGHLQPNDSIWSVCGIPYRDEPEFESGQIVIHKQRCWRELCLTHWFNTHSSFFYNYVLGDKETFHLAFLKLGTPFAMPATPVKALHCTMCQHDLSGRRLFQHRNMDKWTLDGDNKTIYGFAEEYVCKAFLQELRELWNGLDSRGHRIVLGRDTPWVLEERQRLTNNQYVYRRVGYDRRILTFSSSGIIDTGGGALERRWHLGEHKKKLCLSILSDDAVTCVLKLDKDGTWRGRWRAYERMPVELTLRQAIKETTLSLSEKSGVHQANGTLLFRAPLNAFTGYGLHSCEIASFFLRNGINVTLRATNLNETFAPLPYELRKRISAREVDSDSELLLHPPGAVPMPGRRTIYFTMWETTGIRPNYVNNLNRAEHVIVPSAWNASCFSAAGVCRPLHIVPLGIHTNVFSYRSMDTNGPCIFGTAGRFESGGTRKGINQVIEAFQKAFPKERDVCLRVKVFPDCELEAVPDPRVEITRKYMSEMELAEWFAGLTCFVSAARGEGWGLMQQQALAVGRPVISVKFGGVTEFFNEEVGYPLQYALVPADGFYADCGLWAKPSDDHLLELLRQVYSDRAEAVALGKNGSVRASRYSWEDSNEELMRVLKQAGLLQA